MRKSIIALYLFATFFLFNTAVQASESARTFLDSIQAYKEGHFDKAVSGFKKLTDSGIVNAKLFYNLGNAYLKTGNLGLAMIWYERALKLEPDDPDIKFNYGYAASLTKDEKEDKEFPIIRILFFWKYSLSHNIVQWVAVSLNLLFWLIIMIRTVRKKKLLTPLGCGLLIFSLIFTLTACYNAYESAYLRYAVILPEKISVRSGFSEDSTELFALHAGTKVKIEKEKEEFFRIYYSEGKIGWVKKSEAGVI
jgi:tetratricopeptide (TPR) repeat protein